MAEAGIHSRRTRALVTPEGVDLRVELANVSERAAALAIDLMIMLVALVLFAWGAGAAMRVTGEAASSLVQIIWLLGFFILRSFYFTLFEASARAATPGKRMMRLRVAARSGKALSADAVVARNAMRELELYLPMIFLLLAGFADGDVGGWIILFGLIWCLVFALFPVFNRDNLRVGDMIAGTWVVKAPRQTLLPDLAGEKVYSDRAFAFTDAQLDFYGVKELQVLEQVLRTSATSATEAVADRIRTKIGWTRRGDEGDIAFLTAYYQALRRRLEQRLLFGVRKKDKFDTPR